MRHFPAALSRTLVVLVALASIAALAKPGKPDLTLRLKDKLIPLREACFPSGLRRQASAGPSANRTDSGAEAG